MRAYAHQPNFASYLPWKPGSKEDPPLEFMGGTLYFGEGIYQLDPQAQSCALLAIGGLMNAEIVARLHLTQNMVRRSFVRAYDTLDLPRRNSDRPRVALLGKCLAKKIVCIGETIPADQVRIDPWHLPLVSGLARGESSADIAQVYSVARSIVKTSRDKLCAKLNLSCMQLILAAVLSEQLDRNTLEPVYPGGAADQALVHDPWQTELVG